MERHIQVRVFRYDPRLDENPYYQVYQVPLRPKMTVLNVLQYIRENKDSSLAFRASCRMGKCGVCAVYVNGRPVLACRETVSEDGGRLTLEPVPNFPVLKDLVVDRDGFRDKLKNAVSSAPPSIGLMPPRPLGDPDWPECIECLMCDAACPVVPLRPEGFCGPAFMTGIPAPSSGIRWRPSQSLVAGSGPFDGRALEVHPVGTYDCTLCGRCEIVCPMHVETRSLWIAVREALVGRGAYPAVFDRLRETLTTHYNISGDANEDRLIWSENLPAVPEGVGDKKQAEAIYFVGCVASFYPRSYSVPQSVVKILKQAEVDFMTLGGEEWCCGFPLIIAGMGEAAVETMWHNLRAVRQTGAKRLVATCPSCYHTWKYDYPRVLGEPVGLEVLHSTELLDRLVNQGSVRLKPFELPVTYHDPCDLGRLSGIYEAPRNVIEAVPGIALAEMEHNREYALCCGGGGNVEMSDRDLTAAVAQQRVEEARATGARVILSACQQCERILAGATRQRGMHVMDVAELVARQMK